MEVIDRRVMERLQGNIGDDAFRSLATVLVDDLARLRNQITDSLQDEDVERVRRTAHELKGVAGIFGAKALQESCTDLMRSDEPQGTMRSMAEIAIAHCDALRDFIRTDVLTPVAK